MKIFVAGATGNVGSRLIPLLVDRGHQVVGTTRTAAKADRLTRVGAEPVIVDGLDRDGLTAAVAKAEPDVVVHQMTALSVSFDMRRIDQVFATTNRLRTEGTDILLAAARSAGVRKVVAQSFAGWPYARVGGPVKTEEDPLDPSPPARLRGTLDAIRHLESAVLSAGDIQGVVLRYGGFYGPQSSISPDGEIVAMVRKRRFPIVGDGAGVWSFVHLDDVATATAAAIERGTPGIYNIVDDEPARVADWLPVLAVAAGAKPPRHVPVWLGRLAVGPQGVAMMTEIRGASNAKAKRELGWQLNHPSWREGFRTVLS
ncbi:MAG TPA: NAD(P)-dependent oxidoreductase [Candidatus Limnocylindrales bacterium]|nr:NAD(P)-dependent oxidoreductase [Candidatus Limnocylindrales bacterium]